MKAELPTEEDVLAALVLAKAFDPPMLVHGVPGIVVEIAYQRHRAAGKSWSAAIADSERRLEVERAQTEVIRAAYFLAAAPGDSQARLRESVYRMNCARREAGMETLP